MIALRYQYVFNTWLGSSGSVRFFALEPMGRFEPIGLRGEKLMQQCQALPCALMLCWLGDFDNEAGNPDGIMRSVRAKDRQSFKVHPVHAAVGPHDAELTRFVRRAIRPERLHRKSTKGAPILRMHALQE